MNLRIGQAERLAVVQSLNSRFYSVPTKLTHAAGPLLSRTSFVAM